MDAQEWPYRIKSVRRKKRLVKTHRDKQLIQLDKRRSELWRKRQLLPPVPLEQPYQRGWKRFFVLREDIRRSPMAGFYDDLLRKINTVEYHHDKSFKRKKRRRGRYVYTPRPQRLREFDQFEWTSGKLNLTDREQVHFTPVEVYDSRRKCYRETYVFNQPWRYVLRVEPHIITHKVQLDVEIETEMAWINNQIVNHRLHPRMYTLTRGKSYSCNKLYVPQAKYINKIKNIPRYSPKEAYLDLTF